MKVFLITFVLFVLVGCGREYDAHRQLGAEYDAFLKSVAPYVIKKPDEFSYEQRFDTANYPFYQNFIVATGGEINYYHKTDTAEFFFFQHKDLSSLYEHYRGLGGYARRDAADRIVFLNLLYHTPRLTKDEMSTRAKELFKEMISVGNVDRFIGNRDYIHTPNKDFYYNTKLNKWDYTENSSWKFLEEARQQADSLAKQ